MISRRRFLQSGACLALGAVGAGAYARWWEPEWLEFVTHDLPIAHLPASLDGCVLAQISDIHVGRQVSGAYLQRSFDALGAHEPDLVVITGDWITAGDSSSLEALGRVLERLPRARLGSFGILGNHDYGAGWRQTSVADAVVRRAHDSGVTVLRNARTTVDGLAIVGVDDLWAPNFDGAARVIAGDGPQVVLCHNPDAADAPIWSGHRGWILSGHTHGGQCRPPFLPPPILPVRNRRYTAGAIPLDEGRDLYINRGLGHLTKVRFNVRPEITLHRLRRAATV